MPTPRRGVTLCFVKCITLWLDIPQFMLYALAMNKSTVIANYTALLDSATPADIKSASHWYDNANNVAKDISTYSGLDIEKSASVIAAFSPRERWKSNVQKANDFVQGKKVVGLTNNINTAYAAMSHGFNALNGLKTNSFARNIAGDKDAVTIDVWMIRAAGMDGSKSVNTTQYRIMSEIVKELAADRGMYPATAQALIWILARGKAE